MSENQESGDEMLDTHDLPSNANNSAQSSLIDSDDHGTLEDLAFKFTVDEEDKQMDDEIKLYESTVKSEENGKNKNEHQRYSKKDGSSPTKKLRISKSSDDKPRSTLRRVTTDKKDGINKGNNLWVSGLSTVTRAQELKVLFSKHGKVLSAKIVTNTKTPGAKCYGYITMANKEQALACIEQLNHTELHSQVITVEIAKGEPGGGTKKAALKKEKDRAISLDDKQQSFDRGERPVGARRNRETPPRHYRGRGDTHRSSSNGQHAFSARFRSGLKSLTPERDVLTFSHIARERERQQMREEERMMREREKERREEALHRHIETQQLEEAERLLRERQRLKFERERIERQKHELLMLERQQHKIERERLQRDRPDVHHHKIRYENTRSSLKRGPESRSNSKSFYSERSSHKKLSMEGKNHYEREDRRTMHSSREIRRSISPHEKRSTRDLHRHSDRAIKSSSEQTRRYVLPPPSSSTRDSVRYSEGPRRDDHTNSWRGSNHDVTHKGRYTSTSSMPHESEDTHIRNKHPSRSAWQSPSRGNGKDKRGRKRFLVQLGK